MIRRAFDKFKKYMHKQSLSKEERRKLEDMEQLEEFEARQERYNDIIKNEAQKQQFLNQMHRIKKTTYTKKMVAVILFVALLDIQLSYVLAFFDKGQVIEGLSNQLCITILGIGFAYMIRAYFDSKAEHANLDSRIKDELKSNLADKIDKAFSAAGLNTRAEEFLSKEDEVEKTSKGFSININAGLSQSSNNNDAQG